MNCEMCGSETRLYKTLIEGTELNVCRECAKFGKIIAPIRIEVKEKKKTGTTAIPKGPEKETIQIIIQNYGETIKKARESLGLKQEDFAKKINEKESLIHKIETGNFEPNIDLARKLERFLKIKLIEQHEETHEKSSKAKGDGFTIGDFVKVKK